MIAPFVLVGLVLTASAAAAQAPDGKALYEKNCRMCHGPQGVPPEAMVKMMGKIPTLNAAFLASRGEDSVVKVLEHGIGKMKPYQGKLTAPEMAAVAKYVRGMAQNSPPGSK